LASTGEEKVQEKENYQSSSQRRPVSEGKLFGGQKNISFTKKKCQGEQSSKARKNTGGQGRKENFQGGKEKKEKTPSHLRRN